MNKDRERRLISEFLKLCPETIMGDLEDSECPDFILNTENGKTGIELTEVFQDSAKGPSKLQEVSSLKYKLTEDVLQKLEPIIGFKFIIDIDLDTDFPIRKSQRKVTVEKIVEFCVEEFMSLQNMKSGRVFNFKKDLLTIENAEVVKLILAKGYRNLPRGVKEIYIQRWDGLNNSFNSQGEGGSVRSMDIVDVENVIAKKEKGYLNIKSARRIG
jgi:hypothetical protein